MANEPRSSGTAKRPITLLAGPYGHPFHPILVTVPLGAWVSVLVLDVATRLDVPRTRALVYGTVWLLGIGVIGAIVAAVVGLLDLSAIPRRTRAFRTGLVHLALNVVALALFALNFLWRYDEYDELSKVRGGQVILTAVGLAVLGVSGWLGGMLAYRFGVRVVEERDQLDGFNP